MIAYSALDIVSLRLAPLYIEGQHRTRSLMGVTKTNQNHLAPRIHINEGTLFCDLSHYCNELYANGQLFLVSLMHTF